MYLIKQKPEDFVVEEIPSVQITDSGKFVYFWLRKTNMTTLDACQKIADFLGIHLQKIGFAGQKDKIAVTTQLCSVESAHTKKLQQFMHNNIIVTIAGCGDEAIATGLLVGNKFIITVRNTASVPEKKEWFVNFFGKQRFSSDNIAIGRSILQGKYVEAVAIIQNRNSWQKDLTEKYLQHHNSDYVGALRQLPRKLLCLMIQSYQSNLWNIAAEQTASTPSDVELQMPGFGFEGSKEIRGMYETLLAKDNLSFDSFIIKSLPSLSVEAVSRKVWIQVTSMKITPQQDKTILLQFTLPKGSYATEVVRQLFEN